MKSFFTTRGISSSEIGSMITRAYEIKAGAEVRALRDKIFCMMFFNQSLRTRLSFEACMKRFGGEAISLAPGQGTWSFETDPGKVMNGEHAEHLMDAVRVMSRYCDAIGVRSFARMQDLVEDSREEILHSFVEYSEVPVVSLESAMEHPCQALADMLTITEKLGDPRGKQFVLSWAPHVKPLPLAVAHSALLGAAHLGMEVKLCCPSGYEPSAEVLREVKLLCDRSNTNFLVSDQQDLSDASVIYVKSWGAPTLYGDPFQQSQDFKRYSNWCVSQEKLSEEGVLMHCLPVRRNVVIDDAALDSPNSAIIDQAENRMWAQAAILESVLSDQSNKEARCTTLNLHP